MSSMFHHDFGGEVDALHVCVGAGEQDGFQVAVVHFPVAANDDFEGGVVGVGAPAAGGQVFAVAEEFERVGDLVVGGGGVLEAEFGELTFHQCRHRGLIS